MAKNNAIKSTVQGWGADLDPGKRPGFPKEAQRQSVMESDGNDHELIERQVPKVKVLVSTEHKNITPIFGTTLPPKGLSGAIREFAFRYSEGQKAHWLLLMFADRIDVLEGALSDIARGKISIPGKTRGLSTEFTRNGFKSRFGRNRADTRRIAKQAALVGGLAAVALVLVNRSRKEAA